MIKKNTTAYIILGLLVHEDLSGYDIKKKIDRMISHFWEVGYGQIYPTLKTLEESGKITKKKGETHKGPERKLYSITEDGRKTLEEWLKIPEIKDYTRYEILLKLYFGKQLTPKENLERIAQYKEKHLENQKSIQFFKQNLQQLNSEDEDHFYYYLTVLFGEKVYAAYLSWADEAKELLECFLNKRAESDKE